MRKILSFFLGKINFKHLIASRVDVGTNSVGANSPWGETGSCREENSLIGQLAFNPMVPFEVKHEKMARPGGGGGGGVLNKVLYGEAPPRAPIPDSFI